jgi:PGF-CTERM protein
VTTTTTTTTPPTTTTSTTTSTTTTTTTTPPNTDPPEDRYDREFPGRDRTQVPASAQYDAFALQQAGDCYTVQPFGDLPVEVRQADREWDGEFEAGPYTADDWDGLASIEAVMDYRYTDRPPHWSSHGFPVGQTPEAAPWLAEYYLLEPWDYSTYGLHEWMANQESHLFFYQGPYGQSLVVRHDRLYDDRGIDSHDPYNEWTWPPAPGGGTVTMQFERLPRGEWAYVDDLYPEGMDDRYVDASGTRYGHFQADYASQPLRTFSGGDFRATWTWAPHASDGGAYRGLQNLGPNESVTIRPFFNERAPEWGDWPFTGDGNRTEAWKAFSSGPDGRESVRLDTTEPVTITPGQCAVQETTARVNASTDAVRPGGNVTFDASDSQAVAGSIEEYRWAFDGESRTTENPTAEFGFESAGDYTVDVTVRDSANDTASATAAVSVTRPPTAAVEASQPAVVEYPVTFDASDTTDPEGDVVGYRWDLDGDGEFDNRTSSPTATYTYDATGTYDATVTAIDEAGAGESTTVTVEVLPPDTERPTAALGASPTAVNAGSSVTLDATGSTDNYGFAEYHWDFDGDGETDAITESPTITHEYGSAGSYDATVTTFDVPGQRDTANATVRVRSVSTGGGGGSSGGAAGGGGSTSPPPVRTQVFEPRSDGVVVAVQNARPDERVSADLPATERSSETGVALDGLALDLAGSDAEFSVATAERGRVTGDAPRFDDRSVLSYVAMRKRSVPDGTIDAATVTFDVAAERLAGPGIRPEAVSVYRLDGDSWTRLNTSVERRNGSFHYRASADALTEFAVATDRGFAVPGVRLVPGTVSQGDRAAVNATLVNLLDGEREVTVDLTLDGRVVASRTVTLPPRDTASVAFERRVTETGSYRVAVAGVDAGTLTVQPGGLFEVTDVSLDNSAVAAGEEFRVTATVRNTGDGEGTYAANLRIFDGVSGVKQVAVPPGESRTVTFVREVDAPGSYTVQVGNESASLRVTGENESSDVGFASSGGQPGFGAVAAVVALAAAALLAARRS